MMRQRKVCGDIWPVGRTIITGSAASPSSDRGGATGLTGREAPGPSASPAGRAPAVGVERARELSLRDAAERPRAELRGDAAEPLAGVDAPSCAGGLTVLEARNSARGRSAWEDVECCDCLSCC